MPEIPLLQKFHTVADDVVTVNRGSAVANANRTIFTMQDIITTVDSSGGGGTIGGSITAGQIAFGAATANSIEGNANITTNGTSLFIPDYIVHTGDSNTFFGFNSDDNFVVVANGFAQVSINTNGLLSTKIKVNTAVVPDGVSVGSLNVAFGVAPTVASYGTVGDIIITAAAIYVCTATGANPTAASWLKATLGPI